MKIPLQNKIAELERRIAALEAAAKRPTHSHTVTKTVTTEPLSVEQDAAMRTVWTHFDQMFSALGKVFR